MNESLFESHIDGLLCKECEDILLNFLLFKRGIINAECSYFKAKVSIKYDNEIISKDQIKDYLRSIGFPCVSNSFKGKIFDLVSIILIIALFLFIRFVNLPFIPKADNGTSYFGLFLIGLVSGTHCIVMCGGIMLSRTSVKKIDNKKKDIKKNFFNVLLYNFGRVLTSSFLGFIFGLIGKYIIFTVKIKSIIFTLTGIYILLMALGMWGVPLIRKVQYGIPSLCNLKKKNNFFSTIGPILGGVFTALLPCATSNSMWLIAVSSGSAMNGFLTMLCWALGTVPFMILFGIFSSLISFKKEFLMIRANIILMATLGLNLIYLGLQLVIN